MMQVSHPCFYALALVECNRHYACLLLDNRDALVEDPQRNLETSAGLILFSTIPTVIFVTASISAPNV